MTYNQRKLFLRILRLGFFFFSTPIFSAQINIFDVGEGNYCVITHQSKAIIVDGGSAERQTTVQYEVAGPGKTFTITKIPLSSSQGADQTREESIKDPDADVGGGEALSTTDEDEESQKEPVKQRAKDKSKSALLETIENLLNKVNSIVVIITHLDTDHFSWIPIIFGKEKKDLRNKIEGVILNGCHKDYNEKDSGKNLVEWGKSLGKEVIYTGTVDGTEKDPKTFSTLRSSENPEP